MIRFEFHYAAVSTKIIHDFCVAFSDKIMYMHNLLLNRKVHGLFSISLTVLITCRLWHANKNMNFLYKIALSPLSQLNFSFISTYLTLILTLSFILRILYLN